ncbi:MAG: outer membrane porin, OprD family [Campylobacterales bacterium]|nr:outer membrane porin, OprD family [Campylobacterales bacterium]
MAAAAAACLLLATSVNADETKPKRSLKNDMRVVYNELPPSADNITDAFANGMFYGRLRTNAFRWDWKDDANGDNKAFGLGGSLTYKSAPLYGVSVTTSLYYSSSPFSELRQDSGDVGSVKSGKDTFSRYNVSQIGDWQMAVLAEAYVQYNFSKTDFKLGRQIFESALTASNDTKMIPNTFEGISVESKDLPKTTLKAAYFTAQKLRDHTTFHDVLTFGTEMNNDNRGDWNNNDDSGVHRGISYAKLTAAGKDVENSLIVLAVSNESIANLKADLTYTAVPDMISSLIAELNYKIPVGNLTVTPGVRYMKQMDDGAGAIGGASLAGDVTDANAAAKGYTQGDSLDSSLWMARLAVASGAFKGHVGYSKVADEGDIVAPWRGFPTGGYTRAMAQVNWKANAESVMAEAQYDFGKAKILEGFSTIARYAIQDSDEAKQASGGQADLTTIHVDLKQQINPQLDAKFRLGVITADARTTDGKDHDSYNEYRFELNYLF